MTRLLFSLFIHSAFCAFFLLFFRSISITRELLNLFIIHLFDLSLSLAIVCVILFISIHYIYNNRRRGVFHIWIIIRCKLSSSILLSLSLAVLFIALLVYSDRPNGCFEYRYCNTELFSSSFFRSAFSTSNR